MRPDILLHRLVLEFELREYPPPVLAFLRTFAGPDEDPNTALVTFLELVMPPGAPTTLYVANISLKSSPFEHHRELLFRPACEGPMAQDFACGGHTLALSTYRRKGKLVVSRLEVTPHVPLRGFEARVSAPVLWPAQAEQYMTQDDFEAVGRLPAHRLFTRGRLAPWREYLEWKESLIKRSQICIPYIRYRWHNDTCLAFLVRDSDLPGRSLAQIEFDATIPEPPDPDLDLDAGFPEPAARPRRSLPPRPPDSIRLGSVESHQRLDPRDPEYSRPWGKALDGPGMGQAIVRLDEDQARKLEKRELPAPGRLLSSIAGDLKPLRLQADAIGRLETSQGFCPRLVDWLFDARNAGAPPLPAELPPIEGGRDLNPGQRDAVLKALSAPDLCLIQGPPGTGKTTVIADICLRVALAGGRVLVASQTNLAVDNALARLADRPAIRRLRLGAVDRVDEEFKDFLADNVIPRWFASIAEQCQGRMDAADALRAAQRERERALAELQAAHSAHTRAVGDVAVSDDRAREFERRYTAAEQIHEQLRSAAEAARRREAVARELGAWSAGASFPAELPQDFMIGGVSVSQLRELASAESTRGPLADLAAILDAVRLDDPLMETSPEVVELRRTRAWLSESDRDEDLAQLKQINRRLRKLEEEGWSKIGRQIRQAAAGAFPAGSPDCILRLVDALKPEPSLADPLREAKELVRTGLQVADSARAMIAGIAGELAERVWSSANEYRAARAAQERHEQELLDLRRGIDEASEERDAARAAADDAARRWENAYRRLALNESALPVSADTLQCAAERVAEATAADADRLRHAERWRGVQAEWLARLQTITESDRDHLRELYVRHANVVGMTCNEAGKREHWQTPEFKPFDFVIIDEVSKATPTELIMPMLLGERVVLVGDHRQLPPMFRENKDSFADAIESGDLSEDEFVSYRKMVTASLFEELYDQAPATIKATLWTQYRMHPQVMRAVNQFYEDRLEAGPDEPSLDRLRQHHLEIADRQGGRLLETRQHLLWIDSSEYRGVRRTEEQRGSSKANSLEVDLVLATLEALALALVGRGYVGVRQHVLEATDRDRDLQSLAERLLPAAARETLAELFAEGRVRLDGRRQRPHGAGREGARLRIDAQKEVGVLTFYGAQLQDIRRAIERRRAASPGIFDPLDLRTNTVDRFQGMEKAIVIASLVRATTGNLGQFVREYQRINVGLSRAQQLLVIIGAADTWKRARVPLPPLAGGPVDNLPVYANIFQIAQLFGGRRLARQLLG